MDRSLHLWRRGPRSSFALWTQPGVYTLFLRDGVALSSIVPGERGLLYIGLAANREGLMGRCHFDAPTRNHSPRKSFAVLLINELTLTPIFIPKPNSPSTWGLDVPSEARLSAWMHANLELAIELCDDPEPRETELIRHYAPPLNLTKCAQNTQHHRISQARADVLESLESLGGYLPVRRSAGMTAMPTERVAGPCATLSTQSETRRSARPPVGSEFDTADAIAARYGLDPKSYRRRLRDSINWYRKPQKWTAPVDSPQWADMIRVAETMICKS